MTITCRTCIHWPLNHVYTVGFCAFHAHLVVDNYDGPRCRDHSQACDEGGAADPADALGKVVDSGLFSGVQPTLNFSSSGAVAPLESPVYRTPPISSEG